MDVGGKDNGRNRYMRRQCQYYPRRGFVYEKLRRAGLTVRVSKLREDPLRLYIAVQ